MLILWRSKYISDHDDDTNMLVLEDVIKAS